MFYKILSWTLFILIGKSNTLKLADKLEAFVARRNAQKTTRPE